MITKTMSRKSGVRPLLNYLFKDEKKLQNKRYEKMIIRKNVRTRSLEKWVKEFDQNEALRQYKRKDAVKAYHTIISFNGKDRNRIDEAVLKDISRKYMNLRGKDNLYIATAHYDREHVHIHIAESGTRYLSGKANRLSQKEFKELKVTLQAYQEKKYPLLTNSLPTHGKRSAKSYVAGKNCGSQKNELQQALQNAFAKSQNLEGFLENLKSRGHEPYYRNGKLTGIRYDGSTKFRFSRLGYSDDKLKELGQRSANEARQLEELENLRSAQEDSKDKDEKSENHQVEEDENDKSNEDDETEDDTDNDEDDDDSR